MTYIGRFAPSPSGELHFGSLLTAIGSYLQAKSQQGQWLVRIEDIDPPREVVGSASRILSTLESFGLFWDQDILYQSQRSQYYSEILSSLVHQQQAYYCDCTRHRIQSLCGLYDQHCRNRGLVPSQTESLLAIRIKQTKPVTQFFDNLRGLQTIDQLQAQEDFIIHRRDGLFAYNLAVVLDDHYQGITEIVRGADLLESTAKQISLYHHLGWTEPNYIHLPLALDKHGQKLSKQNHAEPISDKNKVETLCHALLFLNQPLPLDWQDGKIPQLLDWAIANWDVNRITKDNKIVTKDNIEIDAT